MDKDKKDGQSLDHPETVEKRPYTAPTIQDLGAVQDLTAAATVGLATETMPYSNSAG